MAKKGTRKAASRTAKKGSTARRSAPKKRASAPKRRSAAKNATGRSAKRPVAPKRPAAKTSKPPARRGVKRGAAAKPASAKASPKRGSAKAGGTGRESTLAQTPDAGRSVRGRTNPMPTKRSTGTAAGAGGTRQAPGLERERKRLREVEESVQGPPSSLNLDRHSSAARSGRAALSRAKRAHNETSPAMTGGDVDADWEDAYAVGDEAPGGDNPTPDQDRVDDIGAALGITYQDNEELKAADKIIERDRHRWELDPASAEDFKDHDED
jgi:hypothetical protein